MNKDTFRGFLCGMLCLGLIMVGNPVFAGVDDNNTSVYERIITAITGNNINTKLDTLHTDMANLTTAVNGSNSGGSSSVSNGIRAKCIKADYGSGQVISYSGGSGFIIAYPGIANQYTNPHIYSVELDGCNLSNPIYTNINNTVMETHTFYFQSSVSFQSIGAPVAVYKYI